MSALLRQDVIHAGPMPNSSAHDLRREDSPHPRRGTDTSTGGRSEAEPHIMVVPLSHLSHKSNLTISAVGTVIGQGYVLVPSAIVRHGCIATSPSACSRARADSMAAFLHEPALVVPVRTQTDASGTLLILSSGLLYSEYLVARPEVVTSFSQLPCGPQPRPLALLDRVITTPSNMYLVPAAQVRMTSVGSMTYRRTGLRPAVIFVALPGVGGDCASDVHARRACIAGEDRTFAWTENQGDVDGDSLAISSVSICMASSSLKAAGERGRPSTVCTSSIASGASPLFEPGTPDGTAPPAVGVCACGSASGVSPGISMGSAYRDTSISNWPRLPSYHVETFDLKPYARRDLTGVIVAHSTLQANDIMQANIFETQRDRVTAHSLQRQAYFREVLWHQNLATHATARHMRLQLDHPEDGITRVCVERPADHGSNNDGSKILAAKLEDPQPCRCGPGAQGQRDVSQCEFGILDRPHVEIALHAPGDAGVRREHLMGEAMDRQRRTGGLWLTAIEAAITSLSGAMAKNLGEGESWCPTEGRRDVVGVTLRFRQTLLFCPPPPREQAYLWLLSIPVNGFQAGRRRKATPGISGWWRCAPTVPLMCLNPDARVNRSHAKNLRTRDGYRRRQWVLTPDGVPLPHPILALDNAYGPEVGRAVEEHFHGRGTDYSEYPAATVPAHSLPAGRRSSKYSSHTVPLHLHPTPWLAFGRPPRHPPHAFPAPQYSVGRGRPPRHPPRRKPVTLHRWIREATTPPSTQIARRAREATTPPAAPANGT
ncbi:hypothetical protein OH76DRAFT_1419425 [Lentinus brumalis]|uniref:Uncharacterized protein n=1 Tax=Lentinus brumalis TaxID=2498619 RepID=A0A371D5J6_9APHY|nr:hypothetical protein OH76DRAFT_1419425 [Polyporus brumalis]